MSDLFSGRWALVTGASSGIGWELARGLARRGSNLVVVARRQERLIELREELKNEHGVQIEVVAQDLTQPGGCGAVVSKLQERSIQVDHLINCAGTAKVGSVHELSLEQHLAICDLNVRALVELTHRLLPAMLEADRGGVLNVASVISYLVVPYMATYAASKAFVLNFSLAMAEELRHTNVRVSALCPGSVPSEFQGVAGFELSKLERAGAASPSEVAELGLRGYERGRRLVIPGFLNGVTARTSQLFSRPLVASMAKSFMRRVGRAQTRRP